MSQTSDDFMLNAVRPRDWDTYLEEREKITKKINAYRTPTFVYPLPKELKELEEKAQKKFDAMRTAEKERFVSKGYFPPGEGFFKYRDQYENDDLFKVIQKFPKGALLHCHWLACGDNKVMVKDFIGGELCYIYLGEDNDEVRHGTIRYFDSPPNESWKLYDKVRTKERDEGILRACTFTEADEVGTSENRWKRFQAIFDKYYTKIKFFEPIFRKQYQHVVDCYVEDNIQYMEYNMHVGDQIYQKNQQKLDADQHMELLIACDKVARETYPDGWFGSKLIHEHLRFFDKEFIRKHMEISYYLQNKYPDHCAAFDLVGEEDTGRSALYYAKDMLHFKNKAAKEKKHFEIRLHGGETDWQTENLTDILMLDSPRIGHGYSIFRFPLLMQWVKQRQICLEISPVSNQVLGLIRDLRNHPIAEYLVRDLPLVVSNDDPSIFGCLGASHDWYLVTMAGELNLLQLRKFAENSIRHAFLSDSQKDALHQMWLKKYDTFLREFVQEA